MFKLIVSIVPHDSGELITSAAASKGAGGGTIMMARGTAQSNIIQLLGLGDTSKDIAYVIVDDSIYEELNSMLNAMGQTKQTFYETFTRTALRERCIPFMVKAPLNEVNTESVSKLEAFEKLEAIRLRNSGTIDYDKEREEALDEKYGAVD